MKGDVGEDGPMYNQIWCSRDPGQGVCVGGGGGAKYNNLLG